MIASAALLPPPPVAHRWQRWLAPLAVLALLLLVIEGWAPRLADDGGAALTTPAAQLPAEEPAVDLDAAVERVTHHPTAVAGHPGTLEVLDDGYRAAFDSTGFSYAPTDGAGAFDLGLATVTRGGTSIPLTPGAWAAEANAAVREVAPGVTERVTARDGEVEWDVVLAAPPAGAGDLTVSADLAGTAGAPATVTGDAADALRFELDGGGRVDLGEVVVLDATGAELHRSLPRVEGGEVSLVVPASVLDGARYPLTVDPTVAGAQTVTEDDGANRPSVAFDGSGYLVVWGNNGDIWGARLNTGGGFVAGPIPISTSDRFEVYPDVAWNGDSYFVVWQYQFSTTGSDWDIYGRRLTASGNLVGFPFVVNGPSADQQLPAVTAATNSGFLVVWQDSKNAGNGSPLDIYGTWVSLNGVPDTTAQRLSFDAKWEEGADVAWNGSHFLVVWQLLYGNGPNGTSDQDIKAIRVNPGSGGSPFGGLLTIASPSTTQTNPSVASDGSRSLVVWDDNRTGNFDIYGSVVDVNGAVSANTPIATAARYQGTPELAYNGVYLAAWTDERRTAGEHDIYAGRVDANGNPVDTGTNGFLVASGAGSAAVGSQVVSRGAGAEWGVVHQWSTSGSADAGVRLNRVSPANPK